MEDRIFQLSRDVRVVFRACLPDCYFPFVEVGEGVRKVPLAFYPEHMVSAGTWLRTLDGLDENLGLSYQIVAGALLYAQKYPS